MTTTPAARIARRVARWLEGERLCADCGKPVDRATAERLEGGWACTPEHAENIARARAW